VINLSLTPDRKYVIATINEVGSGAKNTIVPAYVTESAYTEDIPGRTKVGDVQGKSRLTIIDVETGETKNVDHGQKLPANSPAQRTEMNPTEPAQRARGEARGAGDIQPRAQSQPREREVQLSQLQWSADGKNAVLMARSA